MQSDQVRDLLDAKIAEIARLREENERLEDQLCDLEMDATRDRARLRLALGLHPIPATVVMQP